MNTLAPPTRKSQLLESAVIHHPRLSPEGILQRLFSFWFDGFVYNQIWEDPRVDLEALELEPESRLLTISSGGCNVLNYLTARPSAIYAIDLNRNHLCLLRLKLAALAHLPTYEDFFLMFGCADSPRNVENYNRYLSTNLDPDSRAFWDKHVFPFGRRIGFFARNFYNYSRLGTFLCFLHGLARLLGKDPAQILQARSLAEQEEAYKSQIEPFFKNWFVRFLGALPPTLYSLGIPPQQFASMIKEETIIEIYRSRIKRLACQFPLDDNYFAWQAFGRRYDRIHKKALPDYLKEENFALIKSGLDRVFSIEASLTDFLCSQPAQSLDRFVLLDSQDWMTRDQIIRLWHEIARVGRPGSRIIFRTAASTSPLEKNLPSPLMQRFTSMRNQSLRLFQLDRSAIYGGFHLYVINN